jgi:hypothetical protein
MRHGLSPEVIGDQLGLDGAVSVRLARTRAAFDDQVAIRLVAARARHNCTELEILLAQDGEREIAAHIRRCGESMRAFVSPAEVLGGLAFIEPMPELRRELFRRAPRRRVFGIL